MANKHKDQLDNRREEELIKLDFNDTPLKLCEEYLDVYNGIQLEIVNTSRFNENSDLSTTCLGRSDKVTTEQN